MSEEGATPHEQGSQFSSAAGSMKDNARDEALHAAEKGLEAARSALEAAERKLAEAQRNAAYERAANQPSDDAIPVEPSEASQYSQGASAGASAVDAATSQASSAFSASSGQSPFSASESSPIEPGEAPFWGAGNQAAQSSPVWPHYAAVSSRDHVAAGLLAIFLGGFGVHKFYLGYSTQGFILLAVFLLGGLLSFGLASSVVWIVAIIEGIIYLTKSQSEFERTYVHNKREWF